MNILVVGASGLLGHELCELLSSSHRVYATVRSQDQFSLFNDAVTPLLLDLVDPDFSVLPQELDAIYYLAQSRHFRLFPERASDVVKINVSTPVLLAEWAVAAQVPRFYYASSGGVFRGSDTSVSESTELDWGTPGNFYVDSKLSAELLLRSFESHFESFTIFRPFFIYGPRQESSMLIPRLMNSVIQGSTITLQEEEGLRLNPVFVSDAAQALAASLSVSGHPVCHISGNEEISLKGLCDLMGELCEHTPVYSHTDSPCNHLVCDNQVMKDHFFNPQISLASGLARVYDVQFAG